MASATVPDATESADAAEGTERAETLEPLTAEGHHNPRTIPLTLELDRCGPVGVAGDLPDVR